MIGHITLGSNDLEKGVVFYDAFLGELGLERAKGRDETSPYFYCWRNKDQTGPRFFLVTPYDDKAASVGNGTMIAFAADTREIVDAAYAAGIKAGGACEGAPGERPQFGDGYYGAYLRDPDGNKVHAVLR